MGSARDVLAAMLERDVSQGYVRLKSGAGEMYVWPYFAEADLTKLAPAQEVELYRVVAPALRGAEMKKERQIQLLPSSASSPNGVWHYFMR